MPTLIEIAELEPIVIFDVSIVGLRNFCESIYDAENYADLDERLLQDAKRPLIYLSHFLDKENTFTIKEAISEFEALNRIIATKRDFLKKHTSKKQAKKASQRVSLFGNIANEVFRILKIVESKIYTPTDKSQYSGLSDAIDDLLYRRNLEISEKHKQFYLAALYISLLQKAPVAFIVKSLKFEEGLDLLVDISKNEEIGLLRNLDLRNYPIKLYINFRKKGYQMVYTTKNEKPTQRIHS